VLRRAVGFPFPYVVRCHAVIVGPRGGQASVLEYMDAGSLFTILRRRRRRGLPEPALPELAWWCLMGLAQLHSSGS
jgi:mitogen-activated protein kinase kinase 9